MLTGIDLYHGNIETAAIAKEVVAQIATSQFVILKASEGKTGKDPKFHTYMKLIGKNKPIGAYHFARPDNNSYTDDAENYLSVIKPYVGKIVMALDWEQESLKYPVTWAKKWLDYVYLKTGVKPLIYCQGSYTPKLGIIKQGGYGLWVAHYGVKTPTIGVYDYYAIWQYTSTPFDHDYFNGSKAAWQKYAAVKR